MHTVVIASAITGKIERQWDDGSAIAMDPAHFIVDAANEHLCRSGQMTRHNMPLWTALNRRPLGCMNGRPC